MSLIVYCFAHGPSETVHDGNLIVWACPVITPYMQLLGNSIHVPLPCRSTLMLTRDSMLGSAAMMVDRAFIALFLTCTAGSLDTRSSWGGGGTAR